MNPAEDLCVLKVAKRRLTMDKVDLIGSLEMVNNVNMADSKHMVIMQKTFGYSKLVQDT